MDRRDNGLPVDRLPDPEQTSGGPDASCRATQALQFVHRAKLTLPDVGSGAKGASRSRDDQDMQIVVLVESAVRLQQFIGHGIVVRVEYARPVQRNVGNLPLGLIQDGFIGHAVIPLVTSKHLWTIKTVALRVRSRPQGPWHAVYGRQYL